MLNLQKRTWAVVHLDAIAHNYRLLRSRLQPGVKFLGVVKANAYGHEALPVAALLQRLGCDYLSTATMEEAIALREGGITVPILLFGYTDPNCTPQLLQYRLTQAVGSYQDALAYANAAKQAGGQLTIHLKVDTGMGRLGFKMQNGLFSLDEMLQVLRMPTLKAEGIFTHFATSELADNAYTKEQFSKFTGVYTELEKQWGAKFEIKHCANSGAMVNYEETHLDMVRPGILLYGQYPGDPIPDLDIRPAMELKTRIVQIKSFSAGESISYGRTYTASGDRKIAVIPIGYADGLHRTLSNKLSVLVRGKQVPQVGNICMDMCMIDITDVPDAAVGDVVTVFGQDGDRQITADDLARRCGTISYELLCAVSPRVPRIVTAGTTEGALPYTGMGISSLGAK